MLDYSRSENSKKARNSFHASLVTVRNELDQYEQQYNDIWNRQEEIRKSRAAIIEDMIALLKKHNIKLDKPLSRCNNSEVIESLSKAAVLLPYEPREEVMVAVVRIDERYKQIEMYGKKLEELSNRLAGFYVPEKDYDDEVTISLKDYKIDKSSIEYMEEQPMEDVSLDQEETIEQEEQDIEEFNEGIADFFSYFEERIAEEEQEDFKAEEEQEEIENGVCYTLTDKQTLVEVVEYVYEGQVSWYDLYLYGKNKETLDHFCEEYGYDIEDVVRTKGVLTGLSFEFPQQIKTTKKEKESTRKMAA